MESKKRDRTALWILAGFVATLIVLTAFLSASGGSTLRAVLAIVASVLATALIVGLCFFIPLIAVAIHELGHYLFGRAVGMELRIAQVGPFGLRKVENRWAWYRADTWTNGGGLVAMTPRRGDPYRTAAMVFMILGGPLFSLAFLAILLVIDRFVGVSPVIPLDNSLWHLALWMQTLMAILYAISALVPRLYRGGVPSDAYTLLALRNPKTSQQFMALWALSQSINLAMRARDWNRDLVERAAANAEGSNQIARMNLFAYCHFLDSREADKAMEHISRAAEASEKPLQLEIYRKLVLAEFAFATAWIRKDGKLAEEALTRAQDVEASLYPFVLHRVQAAIHLANNDPGSAIEEAERAKEEVGKTFKNVTPAVQAELELDDEIIQAASIESAPA